MRNMKFIWPLPNHCHDVIEYQFALINRRGDYRIIVFCDMIVQYGAGTMNYESIKQYVIVQNHISISI